MPRVHPLFQILDGSDGLVTLVTQLRTSIVLETSESASAVQLRMGNGAIFDAPRPELIACYKNLSLDKLARYRQREIDLVTHYTPIKKTKTILFKTGAILNDLQTYSKLVTVPSLMPSVEYLNDIAKVVEQSQAYSRALHLHDDFFHEYAKLLKDIRRYIKLHTIRLEQKLS